MDIGQQFLIFYIYYRLNKMARFLIPTFYQGNSATLNGGPNQHLHQPVHQESQFKLRKVELNLSEETPFSSASWQGSLLIPKIEFFIKANIQN